jgi:hypothetical protein
VTDNQADACDGEHSCDNHDRQHTTCRRKGGRLIQSTAGANLHVHGVAIRWTIPDALEPFTGIEGSARKLSSG